MKGSEFWKEGLKFECQGSGNCCVSRGGYGYVYLTLSDRRALAKEVGLSTSAFTRRFCQQDGGIWRLKDGSSLDCVFLLNNRCSVYRGRPMQCRTWPFWPETLKSRAWNQEVAEFCPGVGKGKVWSAQEIEVQLKAQILSEEQLGS